MSNYIQLIVFISLLHVYVGSDHFQQVKKYTVSNDDDPSPLLTEKELKLIRFISYLTYIQTTTTNITWNGWEKNFDSPQLDLDAIRYSLAHIGYTAATLAYRTPNYRELAIKILKDSIERRFISKCMKNYHLVYPVNPDGYILFVKIICISG